MALQIGQTIKLGSGIKTGVAPGGSQFGVGAGRQVRIIGSRNVGGKLFFDIQDLGKGGGTGWTPASSLQAAASAIPRAVKTGPTARQRAAIAANKKAAAFRAKQAKESKALEGEFSAFRKGLEPLDVLRKRLGLELGIPGLQAQLDPLQQRALRLGQLQLDLPETVGALTRGQGEARRKLLETSKGAELSRQLRDVAISQEFFAGQLTGARGELTEQLGVTVEQRDFDLRAFGQQADLLNVRLAREVAGYSTDLQREFESIIGDIERAEDLSDAKVQRAFELAKLELAARLEAQNIGLRSSLKTPSAGEKTVTTAKSQLKADVVNIKTKFAGQGKIFPQLVGIYGDVLNYNEILSIYNEYSPYGRATESFSEVQEYLKGGDSSGDYFEKYQAWVLDGKQGPAPTP